MSKIYNEAGFVNWDYLYSETQAFCMVTGARATGKTYGLLKHLVENGIRFMYLRRLGNQLEQSCSVTANPFKKLNADQGWNIQPYKQRHVVRFAQSEVVEGKNIPTDEPCAIGAALSTFATLRGMDFSDVDCIVFDEAIPMTGEKTIRDEFTAFLHLYETVNRNRELEGKPPVKAFLLGNANKLSNPYYAGWGFMRTALRMIKGNQMLWRSTDGTRIMVMLQHSPISDRKRETALYQNGNDDFIATSLDNAFRVDPTKIKSFPLRELQPVCGIGEIGIYKHKSRTGFYVSKVVPRSEYYEPFGIRLKMFRRDYAILTVSYLNGDVTFEDYDLELIFRELLDV